MRNDKVGSADINRFATGGFFICNIISRGGKAIEGGEERSGNASGGGGERDGNAVGRDRGRDGKGGDDVDVNGAVLIVVLDSAAEFALNKLRGGKKLFRRQGGRQFDGDIKILVVRVITPRGRIEIRGAAEDMPHPLLNESARRVNIMMAGRDVAAEREKENHNN